MFMDEDEDVYIDNRSQSGSKTKEEKIAKKNKKNKENIPEEKRNRSKSFFNIKIKRDEKPRSKTVNDCLSLEAERKTVKFADDGLEKGMRLSEQIGQEKAVLSKSETNLVNKSEVKSCLKETAQPKCEESTVTESTRTEVESSPRIEMAEEITLTIGQAFDLAYKKFMETSGKDIDMKKQFILLQKKVQQLTQENLDLKARVADLERLIDPQTLENFDKNKQNAQGQTKASPTKKDEVPVVGRRLENLMMDDTRQAPQTNGVTSPGGAVPLLAPPPPVPPRNNMGNSPQAQQMAPPVTQPAPQQPQQPQQPVDLFGATPFAANNAPVSSNPFPPSAPSGAGDPFGMGAFNPSGGGDLDRQLQNVDRELMDLQVQHL